MKNTDCIYNNQNGSAVVIALLSLIILTVIGIAATKNTSVELQLASNETGYKTALYNAEAGIYNTLATLDETEAAAMTPNDTIPVPAGSPYALTFLGILNPDISPMSVRVRSDSAGGRQDGNVSILANITLRTPVNGTPLSQGLSTAF